MERSEESVQLRDRAADAFSDFTPSRFTPDDRSRSTYLAPGDDLSELLDTAVRRGLETQRNSVSTSELRLHLTPALLSKLDTADATDDVVGRIPLDELVDLTGGPAGPLPPPDPAAVINAGEEADRLLDEIVESDGETRSTTDDDNAADATDGSPSRRARRARSADAPDSADPRVADKVEDLIDTMDAPESPLRFNVERRPRPDTVKADISTFELRSGPSDVAAYYDFASLQLAFEDVWAEVFDGQLTALGLQLYQECVKLKEFAGLDSDTRSVSTIDDLKGLMDEVRDLAQITADASPSEVRPPVGTGSTSNGVSPGAQVVDIIKTVLDPASVITGGIGDKTIEAVLNPGGALIEAIANLFVGKPQLTWNSFPGPLPVSGDVISLEFEPEAVPAGTVEIVLRNSPQASWWKGIEFREFGPGGVVVSNFRISNDPRDSGVWDPSSYNRLPLYTTQLPNGLLEFQKAAPGIGFGIHTGYYLMAGLNERLVDRMRVTFTWQKDS